MVRNITRVRRRMGDGEGVILRPFRGTPSESAWPRPDGWIRVAFPAGHGRRQKYARINRDRRDVVTGLRMMAATSMLGYGYTEEALRRGEIGRHTSELQSLMRISYAVFCLKKKKAQNRPK